MPVMMLLQSTFAHALRSMKRTADVTKRLFLILPQPSVASLSPCCVGRANAAFFSSSPFLDRLPKQTTLLPPPPLPLNMPFSHSVARSLPPVGHQSICMAFSLAFSPVRLVCSPLLFFSRVGAGIVGSGDATVSSQCRRS